MGSVVLGVGTTVGAMVRAITGNLTGGISALSNCLADPLKLYDDALASGAQDGLWAGSVVGIGPAGPILTMMSGFVSGGLSAGVSSNLNGKAMIAGGFLAGAYVYGVNAGNDALLNNVLSVNCIALTNVVLRYINLFNNFFPVNLREERTVNE